MISVCVLIWFRLRQKFRQQRQRLQHRIVWTFIVYRVLELSHRRHTILFLRHSTHKSSNLIIKILSLCVLVLVLELIDLNTSSMREREKGRKKIEIKTSHAHINTPRSNSFLESKYYVSQ